MVEIRNSDALVEVDFDPTVTPVNADQGSLVWSSSTLQAYTKDDAGETTNVTALGGPTSWKDSVVAATTQDISISIAPATIDDVFPSVGDRILVRQNTNAWDNGIYDYQGSGFTMTRSADMDASAKFDGAVVAVSQGTIYAGKSFVQIETNISIGFSDVIWRFYTSGDFKLWKFPARVASIADVSISSAPASIDGISMNSGDRVLLKDQTNAWENGIYDYNGFSSTMTRTYDARRAEDLEAAALFVKEGTVNANRGYNQTADSVTLDSTNLVWVLFTPSDPSIQTIKRITDVDSPYTMLSTDRVLFCDTDAGAITVNLLAGVLGKNHRIVNTGSTGGNLVTVVPDGSELLLGVNASKTLNKKSAIILDYETTEGWW